MKMIRGVILTTIVAATTVSTFSTPALARHWEQERGWQDRRDDDRYDDRYDRRYRDDDDVRLRGPGVSDLHPWFRNAQSGRFFAVRRAGTYITEREAWMLNREYSRLEGWR